MRIFTWTFWAVLLAASGIWGCGEEGGGADSPLTTACAKSWRGPEFLHSSSEFDGLPVVALLPDGESIVLLGGDSKGVTARRVRKDGTFKDSILSETGYSYSLTADGLGNAIALWVEPKIDVNTVNVHQRRFFAETGWEAESHQVSDHPESCRPGRPIASFGTSSTLTISWIVSVSSPTQTLRTEIHARRYSGTLAGEPVAVANDLTDPAEFVHLQPLEHPNGSALIVWRGRDTVSAAFSTDGLSGWGAPILLEGELGSLEERDPFRTPLAAVRGSDHAIVVWGTGKWKSVRSKRFDFDSRRFTDQGILNSAEAHSGRIWASGNGDRLALACWGQVDSDGVLRLYGRWYDFPSGRWSATPTRIQEGGGDLRNPRLAFNPLGEAVVVWGEMDRPSGSDGKNFILSERIMGRVFHAGGWEAEAVLLGEGPSLARAPTLVSMNAEGEAVVCLLQEKPDSIALIQILLQRYY